MKEAFVAKLRPKDGAVKEAISSAVAKDSGETPQEFSCNICTLLIYNPVECGSCDQLFCKECLDNWLKRGNPTCPMCKNSASPSPLNRIVKKYLDQTVL